MLGVCTHPWRRSQGGREGERESDGARWCWRTPFHVGAHRVHRAPQRRLDHRLKAGPSIPKRRQRRLDLRLNNRRVLVLQPCRKPEHQDELIAHPAGHRRLRSRDARLQLRRVRLLLRGRLGRLHRCGPHRWPADADGSSHPAGVPSGAVAEQRAHALDLAEELVGACAWHQRAVSLLLAQGGRLLLGQPPRGVLPLGGDAACGLGSSQPVEDVDEPGPVGEGVLLERAVRRDVHLEHGHRARRRVRLEHGRPRARALTDEAVVVPARVEGGTQGEGGGASSGTGTGEHGDRDGVGVGEEGGGAGAARGRRGERVWW